MQNENLIITSLKKQYDEYLSKIKSIIFQPSTDESIQTPKTPINRTYIKLILMCFLISTIYLFLKGNTTIIPNNIQIQKPLNEQKSKLNAFIITADCNSLRFNTTKENIEVVFPNFFNFICFLTIPLTDPRIHTHSEPTWKKFSSNLLAFIELWTYKIPEYSKNNELEWSFIFEDDVNFSSPFKVSLTNYIAPLQELIYNPEVQMKDGFVYLGICGPEYENHTKILISKTTNDSLISRKGYGFCLHASGITAKRSRLFWTAISSYRPNPPDSSLDLQLRQYSIRSKTSFYIFGTNFQFPPYTGHYGIAYQDRGRLPSTVAET